MRLGKMLVKALKEEGIETIYQHENDYVYPGIDEEVTSIGDVSAYSNHECYPLGKIYGCRKVPYRSNERVLRIDTWDKDGQHKIKVFGFDTTWSDIVKNGLVTKLVEDVKKMKGRLNNV